MPTLYVTEPGARIEKEYRRLVVAKDDEVLTAVPLSQVSEVVLVGWVGATTPALLAVLDSGVGLTLLNRSGKLRGRLVSAQAGNLPLRRRQFERCADANFCLALSRAIVRGKIHNSRIMALRMVRSLQKNTLTSDPAMQSRLHRLEAYLAQAEAVDSIDKLRGVEGKAAQDYFAILRACLRGALRENFTKRTRRPPKDPVNAVLSLAYTLLTEALFSALEIVGLDPYAGYFHADKYNRPALALDLVEEFRPIIADSVLLTVVNKKILKPNDFEPAPNGGVYLTRGGMKAFFKQFSHRLNTQVYHPQADRAISYQKCFEVQARMLRSYIEGKTSQYAPFRTR